MELPDREDNSCWYVALSLSPRAAHPSHTELTHGQGPFRIYRAPGSVAFLHCGSALQPILPKSQCWCIDEGSSKFILQIRRPQFWRIEVPTGGVEDDERARQLRGVFDAVLLFEKTPCPFQRSFTVVLPERPQTPVKKRPWTPVRSTLAQLPPTPITPVQASSRSSFADKKAYGSPDGKQEDAAGRDEDDVTVPAGPGSDQASSPMSPEVEDGVQLQPPLSAAVLRGKLAGFQASRSVTAPPQLSLNTSPPSKLSSQPDTQQPEREDSVSPTESMASYHSVQSVHSSVQSWHSPITPLPPSPPISSPSSPTFYPYPHENIALPKRSTSHQRDVSDATITPRAPNSMALSPTSANILSLDGSSAASSVYQDVEKPCPDSVDSPTSSTSGSEAKAAISSAVAPRPRVRHRPTTSSISVSRHRALSPLPPAANLFTPHRRFSMYNNSTRARTRLEAVQRIPGAIIHKTCEILLSPPSHLLALMLNVASRIAAGEWRGFLFGMGDTGESIPVQVRNPSSSAHAAATYTDFDKWDYSEDEPGSPDSWGIDDYRDPAPGRQGSQDQVAEATGSRPRASKAAYRRRKEPANDDQDPDWGYSWEID